MPSNAKYISVTTVLHNILHCTVFKTFKTSPSLLHCSSCLQSDLDLPTLWLGASVTWPNRPKLDAEEQNCFELQHPNLESLRLWWDGCWDDCNCVDMAALSFSQNLQYSCHGSYYCRTGNHLLPTECRWGWCFSCSCSGGPEHAYDAVCMIYAGAFIKIAACFDVDLARVQTARFPWYCTVLSIESMSNFNFFIYRKAKKERSETASFKKACDDQEAQIVRRAVALLDRSVVVIPDSERTPHLPLLNRKDECRILVRERDGARILNLGNTDDKTCADIVKVWPAKAVESRPYSSQTILPVDVWRKILQILTSDIEMDGVRSISVVARDICNISQVSKELWTISHDAMRDLSSLCQMQVKENDWLFDTPENEGDPDRRIIKPSWSAFLRQPFNKGSFRDTTGEIVDIATACEIGYFFCHPGRACLDRPALVLGIFNFLHLNRPSNVPFQLLYAVAQERHKYSFQNIRFNKDSWLGKTINFSRDIFAPALSFSDLKFRRLLGRLGIGSKYDFVQAVSTLDQRARLLDELAKISNEEYSERLERTCLTT